MSSFFGRGGSSKEQAKDGSPSSSSPVKKKSSLPRLFKGGSKSLVVVGKEELHADATSFRSSTNSNPNDNNNNARSRIPKALWSSATNPTGASRMRDDSSSSEGGKQVKRSSMSNAGNFMTNTLMAPVVAGKAVVQGGVKAGAAVGNTVSSSVAFGSKAGRAVVAGTSNAVSKGAKGMVKGIKNVTARGSRGSKGGVKSKWEEGIEVIDSILDTSSETYKNMSNKQRKGLIRVKKLLIDGTSGADKTQHIPRDLIQLNKSNTRSSTRASIRVSSRASTFLIEEYGGVNAGGLELLGDLSEWDDLSESDEEDEDDGSNPLQLLSDERNKKTTIARSLSDLPHNEDVIIGNFVPIEFKRMAKEVQMEVYNMLSWDNLKKWDFDVFALNTVTRRRPLMFVAWAILGSPYSQKAMAHHMGLDIESEDFQGYPFMDELLIPPTKLLDYLRVIELDYHASNPYHNAIHAADVIQTLHTLIQSSLNEEFLDDCPNVKLFTILLAAAIHDVDHPGKTNAFHTSMRTELAVMYNDKSVLENWHVAHAFSRMLNIQLLGTKNIHDSQVLRSGDQACKSFTKCDTNILCNITAGEFKNIRNLTIEAVLHTDMTKHFEMVNAAKGLLMQPKSEDKSWKVLMYCLHLSDISSQAKADPLFHQWTNRCMDEFFAQGDEEAKLGLPISPNCDRSTTSTPESQVGFIRFVVEPAFEVLGTFIPFVEDKVMAIISANLDHWLTKLDEESESASNEPKPEVLESSTNPAGSDDDEESPKNGCVSEAVTIEE